MNHLHILLFPLFYLDPGSGSILIQIIIAAVLGGIVGIKMFWGRITGFFRKSSQEADEPGENDPQTGEPE